MNDSKRKRLREQVKRFIGRFVHSVEKTFADVLPAELVTQWISEEVGPHRERLYGPLSTVKLFVEQVLSADPCCRNTVAREASARAARDEAANSVNTGPYCKARKRLSLGLLVRFGREVGGRLCACEPVVWRWRHRAVKLVDGATVSMPDSKENQNCFPQNREQKAGLGFPLARVVAIVSLSCGAVLEWSVGACEGKETGETALMWQLAGRLSAGDVLIADRCYTSYFMIALLTLLGVDVVMRQHQQRHTDFRRGKRLGKRDHVVAWSRPKRPAWMDETTYASMPATLTLREASAGGWTLVTTLLDAKQVSKLELRELYGMRWKIGVSSQGHVIPVGESPTEAEDSSLVAWEVPWRESKTAEPSDSMLRKEYMQHIRLQRAVNAAVASSHDFPVAETVYNVRKQQGLLETSPMRQLSPAGYQRRHDVKDNVETGEALAVRRRNLVEETPAITVIGKCGRRRQGGGSGCSTVEGRAAKRARREGPGPVSTPFVKAR